LKKNYLTLFVALCVVAFSTITAQQKEITLKEIWHGAFRAQGLDALRSLSNGKQYAVLNSNRSIGSSSIDVYNYETGNKVKTLISTSDIPEIPYIFSYQMNSDESKIVLSVALDPVFRRSTLGTYYVYDIATKKATLLSDKKIQEPTFSPDGRKVAYGYKNNLYYKDLITGREIQVTTDGVKNGVINGITDWVYEEEFAFVRAFDWSKDSSNIAFIRFDETDVPEFSMDIYGSQLYQKQQVFKYPKAGEANAKVSLHIYNLNSNKVSKIDLSSYNNYYIPRLQWTNESNILSVQLLNRHQNELDLVFVNATDNTTTSILKETDNAYVEITDNLTFLNNNSFIWTSEKNGWNHIYHYAKDGKLIKQITQGEWEVTHYYGFDSNTGRIYYQSIENGSINRDVYSISKSGRNKVRLTNKTGTNSASFSSDYSYFINSFSNSETPPIYTLHKALKGSQIREITNNNGLKNRLMEYKISPKEFSTLSVNGNDLNMYMIKPLDFNPNKQYPLLMHQYSGPGSQMVANSWNGANDYWHQMLAQQGRIIVVLDPRGTGFKGRDFKKMTQRQLGKYEVQDQIAAAKKLGELPYIDATRIGIWGWSYGGFMSSNCLFQGSDTFSMAIAVAPVGSWRYYDTIYTERYMTTPQENALGYDANSPISHVEKLKGKFLLVHGTADDNVHVQNSMRLVEALVQANKEFDWAIYPDKNHGIFGGNTRLHLYTKMSNFIKDNL